MTAEPNETTGAAQAHHERNRALQHRVRRPLVALATKVELLLTDPDEPLTDQQRTELEAVYALAEHALHNLTTVTNVFLRLADAALDDDAVREHLSRLSKELDLISDDPPKPAAS